MTKHLRVTYRNKIIIFVEYMVRFGRTIQASLMFLHSHFAIKNIRYASAIFESRLSRSLQAFIIFATEQ